MPGIAVAILLLAGGLALGVKGRAPGVAAWSAGLLVLFVCATPLGSGLPGAVSAVFSVIDGAASPVLAGERPGQHEDGSGRPVEHHQDDDEDQDEGVRQVGVDR